MIKIDEIRTASELAGVTDEWLALLERYSPGNVFLSPQFVACWWRHFGAGSELRVYVAREGGELVGVAPMAIGRESYSGLPARMLKFLSNKHTSRADFVVPQRHEQVMAAFARHWLDNRHEWDVLRLVDVPGTSPALQALAGQMKEAGCSAFPIESSRQLCTLPLQGTFEQYRAQQPKKFRENLCYYHNLLKRAPDARTEKHVDAAAVRPAMARLFELASRSWKASDAIAALDPAEQAFYTDLAEMLAPDGGFDCRFLMLGERTVGGLFSLVFGRVFYPMLIYYDPEQSKLAPGRQLIQAVVQECWAGGRIGMIDFNGDSLFVRSWATCTHDYMLFSACHGRLYSRALAGLKRIKRLFRSGGAAETSGVAEGAKA